MLKKNYHYIPNAAHKCQNQNHARFSCFPRCYPRDDTTPKLSKAVTKPLVNYPRPHPIFHSNGTPKPAFGLIQSISLKIPRRRARQMPERRPQSPRGWRPWPRLFLAGLPPERASVLLLTHGRRPEGRRCTHLKMPKRRSLSGNIAIGVFVIAVVTIVVAFCSPSWLVSDYRITGAKLNRLGLWTHCFRSLPDPQDEYQKRFFVGCRWIYDPFTTGYDVIRGYLIPPFMVATQFFFTLTFIETLINFILVLVFFLCAGPDQKRYVQLIRIIGSLLIGGGFTGGIAVIVFASCANRKNWMPGQVNNFLGWSFGLAVVGVCMSFISGTLFLVEANIQKKKRKYLKESQTRFELDQETKA